MFTGKAPVTKSIAVIATNVTFKKQNNGSHLAKQKQRKRAIALFKVAVNLAI